MTPRAALDRVLYKVEERRHAAALAAVLDTPPVPSSANGAAVLTQVCARDVTAYLLAAKTFARHTGIARFVVLDDGSLSQAHRATLAAHLPGLRLVGIQQVEPRGTPARGCWERLLLMLDVARESYVIQLDADTLTLGPMPELTAAVRDGVAFALTDAPDVQLKPIADAVAWARAFGDPHVQIVAESALDRLPESVATRYLRGCAALTGLPAGDRLPQAQAISATMQAALGDRWSEWGTEQVTVNLLTANAPGLVVLRPPTYATHEGRPLPEGARFGHFIGWARFRGSAYRRLAVDAIAALRA